MPVQKPMIPKGTRDFSPEEMVKRNYIFTVIRKVFELFGYLPLETPAMENLSTLLGKYGEEGDKLIFIILNSGNFLDNVTLTPDSQLLTPSYKDLTPYITEKGLRYDLTVPFARFVVQHQNELTFPFKRYQIQPVWRADRPQKGRYREFFQCDVDVIGSSSLIYEAEVIQIADEIFSDLDIPVKILVNNRKVLAGIAETAGVPEKMNDLTTALDKLEKIGIGKVGEELALRGISGEIFAKLKPVLLFRGEISEKIEFLKHIFSGSETGLKGLEELDAVFSYLKGMEIRNQWDFDLGLARGLNYYTGTIIEIKACDAEIGSICGGGRYDDLTGIFGLAGMSGVGISFGADRIYDVMTGMNKFPEAIIHTTSALFVNFGLEENRYAISLMKMIRQNGISSEIYPDQSKLKKQLEYAHRKKIPWVVLTGKDEIEKGLITLRNMATGEQKSMSVTEMINTIKQ